MSKPHGEAVSALIPSGAPKARVEESQASRKGRVPLRAWLRFLDFAASRLRSE